MRSPVAHRFPTPQAMLPERIIRHNRNSLPQDRENRVHQICPDFLEKIDVFYAA
jgi:hypothetical protein